MARGVNKVILIGNLGADPEHVPRPVAPRSPTSAIATSESWKDKTTGETKEQTEWHGIVL